MKSYEPFFDSSPVYDDESDLTQWGVTAITRYDPLNRAVRVDKPDGTLRTVEFDSWHTVHLRRERHRLASDWYAARVGGALGPQQTTAASKAAAAREHTRQADLDSLGRPFRNVADNGAAGQYATTLELDIDGHARAPRTRSNA